MYQQEGRFCMKIKEIMILVEVVPKVRYNGRQNVIDFTTWLIGENYINMVEIAQL